MRPPIACLYVMLGATGLALAQQAGSPAEDSFRMFRDPDLQGTSIEVNPVTKQWSSRLQELDKHVRGKGKSLEWNLPPGVLVVFYDNTNGKGRQFVIWGKGSRTSLVSADFEKRAAAWAWAYVDGWDKAPSSIRAGLSARPLMTQESDKPISENTLELHRDVGAREKKPEDVLKVEAVTAVPEGELQKLPESLDNKASSMLWNLPPGIVVVLYDGADGTQRRMPIWGEGRMVDLGAIDQRISAWAWYDIASEGVKPDPH